MNELALPQIDKTTVSKKSLIVSQLKKFTNDNGKIIPQRVPNMSRSLHTKITKAIKQARFLSLI